MVLLVLSLLALSMSYGEVDDYIRAVDDMVAYKVSFKPYEDGLPLYPQDDAHGAAEAENADVKQKVAPNENWVSMMSADKEEYQCLLPPVPNSMVPDLAQPLMTIINTISFSQCGRG